MRAAAVLVRRKSLNIMPRRINLVEIVIIGEDHLG
jgi:hypothetical protein